MKGQRSYYTGFKDSGEEQEFLAIDNESSNNGEFRYTQDQQRGEHCIHDPIHSDTDLKDETGVVVINTDYNIYIHFAHFSLLPHSPNMT